MGKKKHKHGDESWILQQIVDLLDGVEWSPDTLDEIATLLNNNGYKIRGIK